MNVQCLQKQTTPGRYPVWRNDGGRTCGKCAFYVRGTEYNDREYGRCVLYVNNPINADRLFYVHPRCRGCLEYADRVVEYTEG